MSTPETKDAGQGFDPHKLECHPLAEAEIGSPARPRLCKFFLGGARVDQYREKVQSLQANSHLYAVRS
jgi:hypothetical protein